MSTHLVRYGVGALARRSAFYRRRAIVASAAARLARNRGVLGYSAGSMFNSRRGRFRAPRMRNMRDKGRKRRRVGETPGTSVAKRNENLTSGNLNTRTLYLQPMLDIPRGDNIDQRERGICNFRGVKFCHRFSFLPGAALQNNQILLMNIAILSEKGCDDDPATTDFFRGDGASRGRNFSDALGPLDFHCRPLNTDKWNVHKHKRFKLGPIQSTEGKAAKLIEFYFKLNRQIRYDDGGEVPKGKQLYYVWWFDFNNGFAGQTALAGFMSHDLHMTKYFREPRM